VRRQTKIIGTLGPASSTAPVIRAMISGGIDFVRHNLSHGNIDAHCSCARLVRELAVGEKTVGQIFDLPGAKLRIGGFRQGRVELTVGQSFILDTICGANEGDARRVGVNPHILSRGIIRGSCLLLDDGRIQLGVDKVTASRIICRVISGGVLLDHKGVNVSGGGSAQPAFSTQDRAYMKAAVRGADPDYFAVSFVTGPEDISIARGCLKALGSRAGLIAKIERRVALENLDDIIQAADAVMIARGDLGDDVGDARLPAIQKEIIGQARRWRVPVITATQMMESMISNPVPTRAEVFDVANAVALGTDALMLSGETASGDFPVQVIEKMAEIAAQAEVQADACSMPRMETHSALPDEAIAMAAMYAAAYAEVKAILVLTESGRAPLWMSRVSSCTAIPLYALTADAGVRGRMALYRGVHPIALPEHDGDNRVLIRQAMVRLIAHACIAGEDVVILLRDAPYRQGVANTLEILNAKDVLAG